MNWGAKMKYLKPIVERHDYFTGWTTIPGELLTEKERNRRFRYLPDNVFKTVYVSQRKTYKSFGTRFEYHCITEEIVIID